MTTFQVAEDLALADALSDVVSHLENLHAYGAVQAASEMRNAARPDSGFHVANVPWEYRPPIALAMRQVADGGHEMGDQLRAMAAGLDEKPPHLR